MFNRMVADIAILEAWDSRRESMYRGSPEHLLKKRLQSIEARIADVARSRREVGLLLANPLPGVPEQAAQLLRQLAEDEGDLGSQRVDVLRSLTDCATRPQAQLNDVRLRVHRLVETWRNATCSEQSKIAQGLVSAVGSHPVVYRDGRLLKIGVEWDAVFPDEVRILRYGKNVVDAVEVHRIVARRGPKKVVSVAGP
jgi:hypothetical protein